MFVIGATYKIVYKDDRKNWLIFGQLKEVDDKFIRVFSPSDQKMFIISKNDIVTARQEDGELEGEIHPKEEAD